MRPDSGGRNAAQNELVAGDVVLRCISGPTGQTASGPMCVLPSLQAAMISDDSSVLSGDEIRPARGPKSFLSESVDGAWPRRFRSDGAGGLWCSRDYRQINTKR